ncbi:MAG: hypothetical protein IPN08_02045 [Bacteroidales bacterium]|nr:hypothetical protein [Bacteroidales bacterium]
MGRGTEKIVIYKLENTLPGFMEDRLEEDLDFTNISMEKLFDEMRWGDT